MRLSLRSGAACVALSSAILIWHPRAEAGEAAAAEALFLEGKALADRGEVDAACEKFAESQRLEPSSGTLLNLAACHERQGKTATAWAEYRGAEHHARQQGRAARVAEARRKVDELEPRLSFLTIRVVENTPGMEVRRDGTRIESGGLGTPLPTDPGVHRVTASAPGRAPFTVEVTLGGGGDRREVVVPTLTTLPRGQAANRTPAPPVEVRRDPTLGLAVGGAGLGVAGVSAVFFLLALSADASARRACYSGYDCEQSALDDESRRDTFATVATVGGIAGAAAMGVGAYLLLRPLPAPASGARVHVTPRAAFGGASLAVEGTF